VQLKESVRCHKSCLLDFFLSLFPIIKWIPKYRIKTDLPGDIIGGITTAIIRIPQSTNVVVNFLLFSAGWYITV